MNSDSLVVAVICGVIAAILWAATVAVVRVNTTTTQTLYSATTNIQIERIVLRAHSPVFRPE